MFALAQPILSTGYMLKPRSLTDDPVYVVHVTPTLSRLGGGVSSYLWALAQTGLGRGLTPTVVGLRDPYVDQDIAAHGDVRSFVGGRIGPRSVGYSPGLHQFLKRRLGPVNIIHSHGLRMLPAYEARCAAARHGVPLVISPHGQLDPWVVRRRVVRKKLVHWLYEDRNLQTAACIHATAAQEARHARAQGLVNPIAVVPIGLDAAAYQCDTDDASIIERWPQLKGKKRLLFLALVYPKKGLVRLAEAWGKLHQRWPDWHLVVAGFGQEDELNRATSIINSSGATAQSSFVGGVAGRMKGQLLAASDLYVLPTEGENFGVTIAEALASGLPVITSNTTPWRDLQRYQCGWWIDVGVAPLCQALQDAMSLSDHERSEMGQRGQRLIRDKYAWQPIIGQMRQMYLWLLGRAEKPPFVYTADEAIHG